MPWQIAILFAALAYLIAKHFVCDFLLQSDYQLEKKGIYGHPGGLTHASIHSLGTLPVFLILNTAPVRAVALVVAEWLIHYHCDWTKEQVLRHYRWTRNDRAYWNVFGLDQMVHYLSYLGIVVMA